MSRAEQVTEVCTFHGEGVFWDEPRQRVLLVDMLAGAVVELDGDRTVRHEYGGVAAVVRRRAAGGLVLAEEHGFRMLTDDLEATEDVVPVFDDPAVRMNEGGTDPAGRLIVGSMAYGADEGAGTMYRLDPDRRVTALWSDATIPNGLQWVDGGATALWVDTPTDHVWAFDYDVDAGVFTNRRPWIDLSAFDGHPDGTALDEDGGLWVAMYGGAAVHRFDATGRLIDTVALPVRDITCPAFGGPDRATLYISTSREGWGDEHAESAAGAVFAVRTDTRGAAVQPYAG